LNDRFKAPALRGRSLFIRYTDRVPISPGQYALTPPYELLAAAERGHLVFDQRLIRALQADPARTLPDLIRFAQEKRPEPRVDIGLDLLHLFTLMPSPEAVPLLIEQLRIDPEESPMEVLELAVKLGEPVIGPLIDLFDETGRQHSEVLFVALTAGARGERIESAIAAIEALDPEEAVFLREIGATTYQSEGLNSSVEYPAEASPDLTELPEAERELFLLGESAELRAMAAASYLGQELTDRRRQMFLVMGVADPSAVVRGLCWEALREHTDQPPILKLMAERLLVATDPLERAHLANALADHPEIPGVVETIEASYAEPGLRAKALEAMWRSLDRRWIDRPGRHLDDKDQAVRRQALLAVGYFQLRAEAPRLEKCFEDPELRLDAIFAYALAAPADDTPFGLRQLEKRIEGLAGSLDEIDAEVLRDGLDARMAMAGRRRSPAAAAALPSAAPKAGRNDPCPCGSGKKYKKCCGSAA
jgi:hypothetical protein